MFARNSCMNGHTYKITLTYKQFSTAVMSSSSMNTLGIGIILLFPVYLWVRAKHPTNIYENELRHRVSHTGHICLVTGKFAVTLEEPEKFDSETDPTSNNIAKLLTISRDLWIVFCHEVSFCRALTENLKPELPSPPYICSHLARLLIRLISD